MLYEIKINNTLRKREQKIIIIGNKKSYQYLDYKINDEYFLDVTFKIIPKKYLNYKMMIISTINKNYNTTKICCFIALKFTDTLSYIRIFEYLNKNFNFNPKIIHIDYENSLRLALKKDNIFIKKPIIIFCYFHFIKSIREKLKKIKLCKKKLNNISSEIIKNIQIMCFINEDKVKKFQDF